MYKRQNINKLFVFLLTLFLISGIASANCTVTLTDPQDGDKTSNTLPDFSFIAVCNTTITSATLNISGVYYGNFTGITNNTQRTVTPTSAIPRSNTAYSWTVAVTDGDGTVTIATPRDLTVSRLGGVISLIQEIPSVLGGVTSFIPSIIVILLFLGIAGFITGVFDGIIGRVKGGFKRF